MKKITRHLDVADYFFDKRDLKILTSDGYTIIPAKYLRSTEKTKKSWSDLKYVSANEPQFVLVEGMIDPATSEFEPTFYTIRLHVKEVEE